MSRLYTLSILLSAACATRLASPDPVAADTDGTDLVDVEPHADLTLPPADASDEELETEDPFADDAAPEETTPVLTYSLRRGESLAHFARWAELPVEVVAEASGLSVTDDQLPVGTVVKVPWSEGLEGRIEERREAHHLRRAEGWLASRGGAIGVTFHTVATGETAWSIAHAGGELPVWLLETYNPTVDLDHLRPGQELMLPELPGPVADTSGAEAVGE